MTAYIPLSGRFGGPKRVFSFNINKIEFNQPDDSNIIHLGACQGLFVPGFYGQSEPKTWILLIATS
jgi:hypothetical protein